MWSKMKWKFIKKIINQKIILLNNNFITITLFLRIKRRLICNVIAIMMNEWLRFENINPITTLLLTGYWNFCEQKCEWFFHDKIIVYVCVYMGEGKSHNYASKYLK